MIPSDCGDETLGFLRVLAGRMLLHNASGFERRILLPINEFPMKLFLLVRAPAKSFCIVRRRIAEEILGTKDSDLEINTRKLKQRYTQCLTHAAAEGILSYRLYWLLKGITIMMKSDVRENERLNKMQALMADRCPSASTELKSSRLQLKFLLGEAGEGCGKSSCFRWSKFKPVAEKVREHCLQCWDALLEVQSDPTRWAPSEKAPDCISSTRSLYLHGKMNPSFNVHSVEHIWASSYNMLVHKKLAEIISPEDSESGLESLLPVALCFAVRPLNEKKSDFRFFISAEIVRRKHRLLEVKWESRNKTISWTELKGFKPLVELIKAQFDNVRAGHSVVIMHASLTSFGNPEDGAVNCATVGKTTTIIKLEKPTAKLLETRDKISDNATVTATDKKSAPMENTKTVPESKPSSKSTSDIQEMGLKLLAQEAECQAPVSENENEDHGDDDFHQFLKQGLDVFQADQEDDEARASYAESHFRHEAGEELMDSYEKSVAIQTIEANSNLDSAQQQALIEQVQSQRSLDPVEAVLEVGLAAASGVDSISEASGLRDEQGYL